MTIIDESNRNDIEAFVEAMGERFPALIREMTGGSDEQVGDQQLVAWTAAGEDAFEIALGSGARYQITVRQVAEVAVEEEECPRCFDSGIERRIGDWSYCDCPIGVERQEADAEAKNR